MTTLFQKSEQLHQAFGLNGNSEYEDVILFEGKNIGFSVKRAYTPDLPYKPPVTKAGKPDTVALIRVAYNPDHLSPEEVNIRQVPLWIDIGKHSKYHYYHFGYNYDDEDCPTKESLAISKDTPAPVNLEAIGEYFFDHKQNNLVDKQGQVIEGHTVLDRIFLEHSKTTRGVKRKWWKSIATLAYLSEIAIMFLKFLLRVAFRKGFSEKAIDLQPYKKYEIITLDAKSIEIFGYVASKNVIVTYSALVLFAYTIKFLTGWPLHPFLSGIQGNAFLLLCFALITLPLLEYGGPLILLIILNFFIGIRYWSIRHSPLYEPNRKRAKNT